MHSALHIEQSRDEARRAARHPLIGSPIPAAALDFDFLDQIQEREETLRWLLNSRPRKKNRYPRSKTH